MSGKAIHLSLGRALALAVLTVAGAAQVRAQSAPKVERIDVLRTGIYQIEVAKVIEDKSISTGTRNEAKSYKNVKVTTEIPAKIETILGMEAVILGSPRRAKVSLKVVWRYPQPGLVHPDTKEAKLLDEYTDVQLVGSPFPVFWGLAHDWHLVPGTWTVEIWNGDRKLVTQDFTLTKP